MGLLRRGRGHDVFSFGIGILVQLSGELPKEDTARGAVPAADGPIETTYRGGRPGDERNRPEKAPGNSELAGAAALGLT